MLDQEPLLSRLHIRDDVLLMLGDEDETSEIYQALDVYEGLLILFHVIFKLDVLQAQASQDRYKYSNRRTVSRNGQRENRQYNYKFAADTFVSEDPAIGKPVFANPLLFLRDFSREEHPNAAQSAWLLHMLAFNLDSNSLDQEMGQ